MLDSTDAGGGVVTRGHCIATVMIVVYMIG